MTTTNTTKTARKPKPAPTTDTAPAPEVLEVKQHLSAATKEAVRLMLEQDAALTEDAAYSAVFEKLSGATALAEYDVTDLETFMKLVRG